MAQESCDLCIASSSQQGAEPDHHPVMAPEMSSGVTGPHMDSKIESFPRLGFLQEFLFGAPQALSECLQIHSNQKTIHQNFFSYSMNHAHLSDEFVSFVENLFKFSLFVCFH